MSEKYPLAYTSSIEDAIKGMQLRGDKGPAQLRGHIVNQHLVLPWFGVAKFDIDLANRMDISLDWVVRKGIESLEQGWKQPKGIFAGEPNGADDVYRRLGLPWNEDWCKLMVVKNLIYIAQSGQSKIDWNRVKNAVPGASTIRLDIHRDSYDIFIPGY